MFVELSIWWCNSVFKCHNIRHVIARHRCCSVLVLAVNEEKYKGLLPVRTIARVEH